MQLMVLIILVILVSSIVYMVFRFHKFSFIKNINNKILSWLVSCIPILIFAIFMWIDSINTIIVYLYTVIFFIVCDFIFWIIKKITKRNLGHNISGICAIIFNIMYMSHAYYLAHHVVETKYSIQATKDIGVDNFKIVQVSDSHIGATMDGDDFIKYMEDINKTNPDIVVVTGDFVDDDTSLEDMIKGATGLGKLKTKYGVYFIYGNHDKGYYNYRSYGDKELREELEKNNVIILEDESIQITDNIILVGRQDAQVTDRMSIKQLMNNIDKDKYIIVLDHEPNDYKNEEEANVDLVLSGHTHGGQLFLIGPLSVKLGFNDAYYGLDKINDTIFIVNSGIGDWAIKFKTNTISEYGVIDIKNK